MKEEIIKKSNLKLELSYDELSYFFNGYLNGDVTDDEMTIILKNICNNGLSKRETFDLVDIFVKSGDRIDFLSDVIDKHSTGGVGDKATLVIGPILASLGVNFAKMSGRALGYTGGTIDKLESVGIKTNLSLEEIKKQLDEVGFVISSQTKNICPMDKKVYALRDVTGTTCSIPLIAVSIMSKKIAGGSHNILIDIKVGRGALIKNKKEAKILAKLMIEIGNKYQKKVVCMLTRMDNPLGNNIGNSLEVLEVLDVLKNEVRNDLYYLCFYMSSIMVSIYKNISLSVAEKEVAKVLSDNSAYDKFMEMVAYHGRKLEITLDPSSVIVSKESGYVKSIDAFILGKLSMELGAGRHSKDDKIDYNCGIEILKNVGDYVSKGEILCRLYTKKEFDADVVYQAYSFSKRKPRLKPVIIQIIK